MIGNKDARNRVVIEGVTPEINGGRFPAKRIIGDRVIVEADIFADGHDALSAVLLYRKESDTEWIRTPMQFLLNDRWRGSFTVTEMGCYYFTITAWVDRFKTWRQDVEKKVRAKQYVYIDLIIGAQIIEKAIEVATGRDTATLRGYAETLRSAGKSVSARTRLALSNKVAQLMAEYSDKKSASTYPKELAVIVEREKAGYSTWYEMFPRSCTNSSERHGTFKKCENRLPYIAGMGFDVLYLPPIYPVGSTSRKGRNNNPVAGPNDPGTPWAIGSEEGGFRSINPQLGTLEDFRWFLSRAREYGLEVALDIAFQCSPDHPYVKEHPEWFHWRSDGTIQYAENPPKKYQDIYPLDFETEHWRELWEELKNVVLFWIECGVRIFRVDNPHTKPFAFWEWLISEIKKEYPEVIFLSEAFTRPKVMYRLAKLGFTQSYTYFTWRTSKWELTQYFTELTQTGVREFFRPNLWPNTPDILSDYLRDGGRPAFLVRLALAATLGANYGIYGPAYELCENHRKDVESEEYLNSEKYEIKHWDIENPRSIREFITRVNTIRHQNPALQGDLNLRFHSIDNDWLICYSKRSEDMSNVILVVINLDYRYRQSGWTALSLEELGLNDDQPYLVHDLLNDACYRWQGPRNYVDLDPEKMPAHIFQVRRHIDTTV